MRFLRWLHATAEVLQVKSHDVIQAIDTLESGIQSVPVDLHLLSVNKCCSWLGFVEGPFLLDAGPLQSLFEE